MKNNTKKFIIPLLFLISFIFFAFVIFCFVNSKKEPKLSLEEEIYNLRSDIIPQIYVESKKRLKSQAEINTRQEQIDNFINELQLKEQLLTQAKRTLREKENLLNRAKNELQDLEREKEENQKLISKKEQQLISERNRLYYEQNKQINQDIHTLHIRLQELLISIEKNKSLISRTTTEIQSEKQEISQLNNKITHLKDLKIWPLKEKICEENKIKYKFENYLLLRSFYISVEKILKLKEEMDSFLQELNKYNSSFVNAKNNLEFMLNEAKMSSELINLYTSNKLLFPFLDSIKKDFETEEYKKKEKTAFDEYIKQEKQRIEEKEVLNFRIHKLEDKKEYFKKVIQIMDNIEEKYTDLKLSDRTDNYIKEKKNKGLLPDFIKIENNKVIFSIKNSKEKISENIFESQDTDNNQKYVSTKEDNWTAPYKQKFNDKFHSSLSSDDKNKFHSENEFRQIIKDFAEKHQINNKDYFNSRKWISPLGFIGLEYCLKDECTYKNILPFLIQVINEFLVI
ncbi:hypothetical protein ['Camptotheca acuminata' phytoplasma]|uniref:hypothetical protein n=1 Tax='Camptotheca acuminata' phytoplasma TaxID=3239192 RepID=UPI00351A6B7A